MKVSVIIPCYNVERYISECIKSIEQQTYKNIEVICVNDGSTDKTLQKLEENVAHSKIHIKLINQENKGASNARNQGLKYASGYYIQFLDADDILKPDKIRHQVDIARNNNFPDLIVGSYQRQNMKGEVLYQRIYNQENHKNVWASLMKTDLGITSSNLFKSDLFTQGIKWNEEFQSSQEYELMFQILKKNAHIVYDKEINTIIRTRDSGSISQTNLDKKWERYVQLRIDMINYIKEKNPEIINDELYQILFESIRILYRYNASKACYYFEQNIPKRFIPRVSSSIMGKSYVFIYKLLGFKLAEQIRRYITTNQAS